MDFYHLQSEHVDPARLKKEREVARKLKKSHWWQKQLSLGICHYCSQKFHSSELTMDHVVPLARGGRSRRGNLVPACRSCNQNKRLQTPAEQLFSQLS